MHDREQILRKFKSRAQRAHLPKSLSHSDKKRLPNHDIDLSIIRQSIYVVTRARADFRFSRLFACQSICNKGNGFAKGVKKEEAAVCTTGMNLFFIDL